MALDKSNGFVAASGPAPDPAEMSLPLFSVERVQLQFSMGADFVAAQVANNVLILALATGRILRIDLDSPADIDGMGIPFYSLSGSKTLRCSLPLL
jgi:hypothetical protein